MKIRFRAQAREEFRAAFAYYESEGRELAIRFARQLADAIGRIVEYPSSFPLVEAGCRRCRLKDFPYGVVYRVKDKTVEVFSVMHLHRRPGYWRDRLPR